MCSCDGLKDDYTLTQIESFKIAGYVKNLLILYLLIIFLIIENFLLLKLMNNGIIQDNQILAQLSILD